MNISATTTLASLSHSREIQTCTPQAQLMQGPNMDHFGARGDDQPWPDQCVFMEELSVQDDVDNETWVHNVFMNARNKSGAVRALQVTEAVKCS
jgi:hypothetical protein